MMERQASECYIILQGYIAIIDSIELWSLKAQNVILYWTII